MSVRGRAPKKRANCSAEMHVGLRFLLSRKTREEGRDGKGTRSSRVVPLGCVGQRIWTSPVWGGLDGKEQGQAMHLMSLAERTPHSSRDSYTL